MKRLLVMLMVAGGVIALLRKRPSGDTVSEPESPAPAGEGR